MALKRTYMFCGTALMRRGLELVRLSALDPLFGYGKWRGIAEGKLLLYIIKFLQCRNEFNIGCYCKGYTDNIQLIVYT